VRNKQKRFCGPPIRNRKPPRRTTPARTRGAPPAPAQRFSLRLAQCLIANSHAASCGPRGARPRPVGGGEPGAGAGAGPNSGVNTYAVCVFGSTVIVRAPFIVVTVATVVYLSGESSCTTVTLPSPPLGM